MVSQPTDMLPSLDIRTLLVTCAIVFAGVTLALAFVWRQTRPMAGIRRLALAHGLTVAAAGLFCVRDRLGVFSDVAGDTLLILAVALLHEGTRLFFGLPAQRVFTLTVVPAAAALLAFFASAVPSEHVRTLAHSGLLAALFARVAWLTFRCGRREAAGLPVLLMSLALLGQGGAFVLRFTLSLVAGPAASPRLAPVTLLVALSAPVAWTIGLVSAINQRLTGSVRAARDLFENLVEVARATSAGPDLRATLHGTLEVANKLTGALASSLILSDEAGRVTRALHTRGAESAVLVPQSERVMREGLAGWVALRREATLVEDTLTDERWACRSADDLPARSALGVPISSGSALVGVLTLVHAEPGHFTEEHRRLMGAAATQIALALRNAQISDARLSLATRQSLLYEVLRATSRPRDPAEIAEAAANAIASRTSWTRVVVALPAADGVWRLHGGASRTREAGRPLASGVVGRAFTTGQTQIVTGVSHGQDGAAGSGSVGGGLAVPLRHAESTLGVLHLESDTPDAFGTDDVQLAESLAEVITLSLENARLYLEISAQSARLAAVIESSRDGLLLVGPDARLLLVNEPGLQRLALSGPPADWIGQPVDALVGALTLGSRQAAAVLGELSAAAGTAPSEGEWALGANVIEWLNLPVPSLGRLLVLRDVTRERQAEHMREMMTHTLVHDLRNPLAGVLGALDLLAATPGLGRREAELLRLAHDNARRQLALINGILDVSRLEGSAALERQPVALPELVSDVLRLSAPRAAGKGVTLHVDAPPRLPQAWLDRDLIARVLENLVVNAIRYSPTGGTVRVSVGRDGAAGLSVSVRDEGPGVAADLLPRLFQKFSAGSQRGHGSGLGLFFCRLAVERHGGRIWVADAGATSGATFVFTLPAGREAAAAPLDARADSDPA